MKLAIPIVGLGAVGAVTVRRVAARYCTDNNAAPEGLAKVNRTIVSSRFGDVEYAEEGSGKPLLVIHGIFVDAMPGSSASEASYLTGG